jgi:DNA-binding YbaB/EbfC family protein
MNNMNQMMKQAKKMQEQMEKIQQELGSKTVEGTAQGVVTVVANGHKQVLSITIKPEAVDPEDVEMLQDLILTAVNDAIKKAEELSNKEMSRMTGGMKIPGLF